MDAITGFLVVAVLFGIVFLYQKAVGGLRKKANQAVFSRKAHREGQELVSQELVFTARASAEEVRKAILSMVKVAPQVPPVIMDAHLIKATDNFIIYGYGNKLNPQNFRALLSFSTTPNGVQGSWEIANWTLADGVVTGQSVMKRLTADINAALRSVDPNAVLRPASRVAA